MKPEPWQVQEAIEYGMKRPEYRASFGLTLAEFLKYTGLLMLDDLLKNLSEPSKPRKAKKC